MEHLEVLIFFFPSVSLYGHALCTVSKLFATASGFSVISEQEVQFRQAMVDSTKLLKQSVKNIMQTRGKRCG